MAIIVQQAGFVVLERLVSNQGGKGKRRRESRQEQEEEERTKGCRTGIRASRHVASESNLFIIVMIAPAEARLAVSHAATAQISQSTTVLLVL